MTTLEEQQLNDIVRRVLRELAAPAAPAPAAQMNGAAALRGVFTSPEAALEAVGRAQTIYRRVSLARRRAIVDAIRETAIDHAQRLAQLAVQETRMGRVADKVRKHLLVAEKTPGVEFLPSASHVGDDGLTMEEPAPFGTILAITPTTNPTATILNNAISMLAAGNTVYFAPHPRALRTSLTCIDLVNEAIEAAGGPPNLLVATDSVDLGVVQELMRHPKIALICATGGPAVVDQALSSGKRAIGAAAGNPPVLVDDTADPLKAAADIIAGHSFDNNLPCTSEKEVIVTAGIADALMHAFRASPAAVVLDASYLPQLEAVVLNEGRGGPNPKYIGQNANLILRQLGIEAGDDVRCVVVETDKDHPFVRHELMLPVLSVVRAGNFEDALDVAVEVEGGLRHSAVIHSANIYHMSEFGRAINTSVFVKNAPSYAGLGFTGEGYTSFTIAGRTGEGMTTARTFSRLRRCTLVGAFSLV
ncbi:MAG TPA: aldehyde dehydrogenase EutE [Chloroflexaceae bacterium]|nr:aldehyde dehydrogenase EutE [Chloroflexaceae bacterium]